MGGLDDTCGGACHARDLEEGSTLVEVLVSIVLIGSLVVATLLALRTSILASSVDRDHANAHAWLQTASDVLYGMERLDCGTETASLGTQLQTQYQDYVRTNTTNPEGWPANRIAVVGPVLFWDGKGSYQSICYDDAGVNLQLIQLEVRAPDGRIVESVQIVKG